MRDRLRSNAAAIEALASRLEAGGNVLDARLLRSTVRVDRPAGEPGGTVTALERKAAAVRECKAAIEVVWQARLACKAAGLVLKVHDVVERLKRAAAQLGVQ